MSPTSIISVLTFRTHSDTTLALLRRGGHVSADEEKVLGPWEWSQNEAVLHWDERVSRQLDSSQMIFTKHSRHEPSSRIVCCAGCLPVIQ